MTAVVLAAQPSRLPLGASCVQTEPFEAVRQFGRQVLGLGGILLVSGPPGTGKTFALDELCSELDVFFVKLHLGARPRGHEVLRALLRALGCPSDARGGVLLDEARAALVGRRVVIYVDEAHLLNREALRQIRWLYDQAGMRFALFMTGVDFSDAFASVPELESRIARRVRFGRLEGARLVRALRAHHPILAATDEAVLRQIDHRYCRGVWRHWEHVLVAAAGYRATAETGITETVASAVLVAITGEG